MEVDGALVGEDVEGFIIEGALGDEVLDLVDDGVVVFLLEVAEAVMGVKGIDLGLIHNNSLRNK